MVRSAGKVKVGVGSNTASNSLDLTHPVGLVTFTV